MLATGVRGAVLLAVGLLVSLAVACGGSSESEGGGGDEGSSVSNGESIAVALEEWSVKPAAAKHAAGEIAFKVQNKGATPHELAVVQTDLDATKLPQASGLVDEKQIKVLGRTKQLAAGKSEELELKLAAGKYALICNIAAHYGQGMHAAFTVE